MLATFFEPRRPQDAPRRLQDGHQTPQDAPKTPQEAPRRSKTPQDAPKAPKTLHFGRFLEDFWEIFWKIFGRFFGRICRPTCLLKLTFEKSLPPQIRFPKKASQKTEGPAVIAAGVGNPPAPGLLARVQERVQNGGLLWPILGLEWPPRIRRGCLCCHGLLHIPSAFSA